MASQRIKGQEVTVSLIANNAVLGTVTAVKSFDFSYQQEIQKEGYVGETADRVDAIYNGIEGNLEFHTDTPDVLALIGQIVDKAQRRTAGMVVNIRATFNYPSGRRAKVIFPDVEFGEIPVSVGGRADYVGMTLNFACTKVRVLLS